MLTERTRRIVEDGLGRSLTADEENGYSRLAELPATVIASARKIREASNSVAMSVYLQHIVPSATLDEIQAFIEEHVNG